MTRSYPYEVEGDTRPPSRTKASDPIQHVAQKEYRGTHRQSFGLLVAVLLGLAALWLVLAWIEAGAAV